MPFTPSHAVVALPFIRTPLVPAAIAIGAMTPDLPIFLRGFGLRYSATHTWSWLPVTVVVALALLLVWRCVLRPVARDLVPMVLAERLPDGWDAGARASARETFALHRPGASAGKISPASILLLVVSLAIGVASHIAWDLFTHLDRWGLRVFPLLAERWGPLLGYKWLQYGSSVFGLLVIGIWAVVWLRPRRPVPPQDRAPGFVRVAWWISLPAFLVIAWVGGLMLFGPLRSGFGVEHLAYLVLPPAVGLWGGLTLVLAIVLQLMRRPLSDV
ncbi:conserved membrane hypothetical protein [Microbacterium sp. C448]|uniref:DUF4184 family protein n=1 Tax=Microbacterium TaxID=33882 RepID=UPI0003DE724A|nr:MULTISPECIES: DUF4184 family protein [Microbacterium]MDO8384151.1 DUF4184 family protein [Microbacterium sp.]CDK00436.1 conserved membrane hypothetical protein [Microbacterium sp. C448]